MEWLYRRAKNMVMLALVTFMVIGCPSSSGRLGWNYVLGRMDIGDNISQTPDGGYFIAAKGLATGATNPAGVYAYPYLATRLDSSGRVEWSRFAADTFAQSAPSPGAWGVALNDASLVGVGLTGGWNDQSSRLRVMKYDSAGEVVWTRTYGDEVLLPQGVVPNDDGGVTVAGLSCTPEWESSIFVLRLDRQGDVVWRKDIGPEACLMCVYHLAIAEDQSVFLVGTRAQVLRVSATGELLWVKSYGLSSYDLYSVATAPDGGIVLGGISIQSGAAVPAILKIDIDGTLLWAADEIVDAPASSHYTGWDVAVDAQGQIALVGECEKVEYIGGFFPRITDSGYILQLDDTGNLSSYKNLGSCYVHAVTPMASGGFITAGTTGSHLQVIRIRTDGTVM